jgi:SagB-type dehydrogenase family enzyme
MNKIRFSEIMNLLLVGVIIILIFRLTPQPASQIDQSIPKKAEKESAEDVENEKNRDFVALSDSIYQLPSPRLDGDVSVEQAIANRRSRRDFSDKPLTSTEISQILWAAYGITKPYEEPAFLRGGLRTAPSAGARYPLNIYLLAGNIKDIPDGLYLYISKEHQLKKIHDRDIREELAKAALDQLMLKEAAADLVFTATFERTTSKYGERGKKRYVPMDIGHSGQNVYLQAEALGLGTCAVGAFTDEEVKKVLELPEERKPLYIMPLGYNKPQPEEN